MSAPGFVDRLVDRALEASVVGSFTSLGHRVRSRLGGWGDAPPIRVDGQVAVVTGANRGIGKAIAAQLASRGATVIIAARSPETTAQAATEIAAGAGVPAERVEHHLVDLANPEDVARFGQAITERHPAVHVLVHNAGALLHERSTAPDGNEMTVAVHLLGPIRLTAALRPALAAAHGRVIFMSSGGMYAERLDADRIEMAAGEYSGVQAYARVKRAQVAVAEEMAQRLAADGITVHAAHPGWVDTPGVTDSLPTFKKVVGRWLRTPDQGADTVAWLATAPEAAHTSGRFWHDRRPRRRHWLPWTRPADEARERQRVWEWCRQRAGVAL